MMIPGDLLIFQYFRYFDEATQMNALTVSDDDLLLQHTGIANVVGIVGNILMAKKSQTNKIKFENPKMKWQKHVYAAEEIERERNTHLK